ncbi:MAG: hypothetical protein B5M54_02680 [Candidatus Aminicenantes bacterium 4484_214]|nr:MAG: hypothetical protein B5M54_02680 [Candidatus Aminicenantes bacterium 4484_214]
MFFDFWSFCVIAGGRRTEDYPAWWSWRRKKADSPLPFTPLFLWALYGQETVLFSQGLGGELGVYNFSSQFIKRITAPPTSTSRGDKQIFNFLFTFSWQFLDPNELDMFKKCYLKEGKEEPMSNRQFFNGGRKALFGNRFCFSRVICQF